MSIRTDLLPGFGNRDFFRVFVGTLGIVFVAVIAFALLGDNRLLGIEALSPAVLYVAQDYVYAALTVVGVYVFGVRMSRLPWAEIGFRRCSWDWIVRAFLAAVLIYAVRVLADGVTILILGTSRMLDPTGTDRTMLAGASHGLTASFIFAVTVVTPLATEIFQRGILFAWLRRNFNFILSAVSSAAIFGVLHIEIVRYAQVLIFGVLAAYLYEKSRSLWPSLVLHTTMSAVYIFGVMKW